MKKFLKVASIILVIAMVACFAACGAEEEKPTLTMATNAEFPPYEFVEGEKIVGIDAEIAGLIAE